MKSEKKIKRAVYIAIVALLALVLWCYWVSGRIERGEPQKFLSDGAVTAISIACAGLAIMAVGYAVFIVAKAFHAGLTDSEPKEKHDHDA